MPYFFIWLSRLVGLLLSRRRFNTHRLITVTLSLISLFCSCSQRNSPSSDRKQLEHQLTRPCRDRFRRPSAASRMETDNNGTCSFPRSFVNFGRLFRGGVRLRNEWSIQPANLSDCHSFGHLFYYASEKGPRCAQDNANRDNHQEIRHRQWVLSADHPVKSPFISFNKSIFFYVIAAVFSKNINFNVVTTYNITITRSVPIILTPR